jgi:ribose transport system ATP-binding protein
MAEIRALSDRVTILRSGRRVGTVATPGSTDHELIEMMVGRPVEQLFPHVQQRPGLVRLAVTNMTTASGSVRNVTFAARAGEIVGLAGLVGCGRSELCRAVFGLEPIESGSVEINGKAIEHPTPSTMLANKICYFPADRAAEGLALGRPARENVTMSALADRALAIGPLFKFWRERQIALKPLASLGLRPLKPERRVSAFSGGNQQKVMLARGLLKPFDLYLFDEPTVGIDVGAKADVYGLIKSLTEAGACVVLSTSELPELINLASRIYVMHEGAVVAEVSGDAISESRILSHYFDAPGQVEVER